MSHLISGGEKHESVFNLCSTFEVMVNSLSAKSFWLSMQGMFLSSMLRCSAGESDGSLRETEVLIKTDSPEGCLASYRSLSEVTRPLLAKQ